ncbi:MAG: WD40 repeat domain-containing protein [Gemmataceae bacterium]
MICICDVTLLVLGLLSSVIPLTDTVGLTNRKRSVPVAQLVATFSAGAKSELTTFSLSSDGKWLALGTESGRIYVWAVKEATAPKATLCPQTLGRSKGIHCISFSRDGKRLACLVGERNGSVQVWSVATGKRIWGAYGIRHPSGISFSPDGKYLAVTDQRTLQFYTSEGKYLWAAKIDTALRTFIEFTSKGRVVTGGHGSSSIRVWDQTTGRVLKRYGVNRLTALAWDANTGYLLVGALGQYLSALELGSGKTIFRQPPESNNSLQVIAIPAMARYFLSGTDGSLVTFHDRRTGKELSRLSTWSSEDLAVTRDGTLFAVPVGARKVGLWKVKGGR